MRSSRTSKVTADLDDTKADLEAAGKVNRKTSRAIEALLRDRADDFLRWAADYADAAEAAMAALREPYEAALSAWREAEAAFAPIARAAGTGFVGPCPLPEPASLFDTGTRPVPVNLAAADLRHVELAVWEMLPGSQLYALSVDDVAANSDIATRSDFRLVRGKPELTADAAEIFGRSRRDISAVDVPVVIDGRGQR